jgi:hypothetical protein
MSRVGFCQECGRYVAVGDDGCPDGHPRSAVRDVREVSDGAPMPLAGARPSADSSAEAAQLRSEPNEAVMQVVAKSLVIVPAALILAFLMWSGVESEMAFGVRLWPAIITTAVSLVVTFGMLYLWRLTRRR